MSLDGSGRCLFQGRPKGSNSNRFSCLPTYHCSRKFRTIIGRSLYMVATHSEDVDLASRVNVSIATVGGGGGGPYPRGDREPLVRTYQTGCRDTNIPPPQDIHTLTIVRPYWNPSHTVMCPPPVPPASRWRRSTEIQTTYF